MLGCKIRIQNTLHIVGHKRLARKHIQVHVVGLLHKMCTDVGGLNELDKRVSLLVAGSKQNDLGLSVGHHVDFGHEILGKMRNCFSRTNGGRTALARVENEMISPVTHV